MRGTKEQDPLSLHFFVVVKEFAATTAKTYSQSNEKIHTDHNINVTVSKNLGNFINSGTADLVYQCV